MCCVVVVVACCLSAVLLVAVRCVCVSFLRLLFCLAVVIFVVCTFVIV